MNISLKIEGQSIEVDSVLQLASDTVSQVDCSVQLSAEWSDFDLVKCVWENQHIAEKYVSTITNGTTEVPQEVLTERGSVRVNLVGYDVTGTAITERLTTYKIQVVAVKQKVNITGTNSASPTAAEWQQQLTAHTGNTTVHVTEQNKTDWNAKLSDAPSDSKTYGRKNGQWTEVTGGGGSTAWNDITGKPETFPPSVHNHNSLYYGKSDVYTKTETDTAISNHHDSTKANASHTHTKSQISDFAHNHDDRYYTESETDTLLSAKANTTDLSEVATSGDYEDLSNKPTIPTVPTNVSAFTNDAGYLTQHQSLTGYATEAWVGQQGFGTYTKPASGIPSTDLTSAVQTSLTKADTALQSVPATYRTSAEQDVIDNGKQPTLTSGTNIKTINNSSLLGSGNIDIKDVAFVTLESTWEDVVSAHNSGKMVVLKDGEDGEDWWNDFYVLGYVDETEAQFNEPWSVQESNAIGVGTYTITPDTDWEYQGRFVYALLSTIPSPSEEYKNVIYHYKGTTTSDYTHGHFYECYNAGGDTYAWREVDVQNLSAYRTASAQDVIDGTKADKRTVATTIGAVATANTDYFLGEQSTVSVTLPSSPSTGDLISVVFYSGATATSLSVSGTVIGDVPTPTTNQRVELNMLYDGSYWAVLSNVMEVS